MTERKQISLQKDDTQAALDALGSLQSSLKDALHSLLVSHCAGYMSSTEYGIKRSSIEGHISNCEIIRAAITAQLTKTDDNVSCPSVANMGLTIDTPTKNE